MGNSALLSVAHMNETAFLRLDDGTLVNVKEITEAKLKQGLLEVTRRHADGTSHTVYVHENPTHAYQQLQRFSINEQ